VRLVDRDGVHERSAEDVEQLVGDRADPGFWWVDVPEWNDDAETLLQRLGAHEMVVEVIA